MLSFKRPKIVLTIPADCLKQDKLISFRGQKISKENRRMEKMFTKGSRIESAAQDNFVRLGIAWL